LVDTTGRIEIWKNIIDQSSTAPIFGKGSQADRWYLDRIDKWKNNASNSLFYSLICGGLLGVITCALIMYETIKLLLNCVLKLKFFRKKNNNLYYSAFFILIFLLLRSIVENSFMIFSIDNLIFLSCFFLLKTNSKINQ
jgi:O-antigen ligase